ncbi:MAG TPA: HEAT repeat domain-containing protein [Planctomycetota bacterium]
MNPRLPLIVLVATVAAIAAAAFFARKTRAVPPRPMPAALAEEVDRLRVLRRAAPAMPAGGVGHADYAKRLDRVRAAEELLPLEDVVLDRREDAMLRVDLLAAIAARPGEPARLLCARLASDPEEPTSVRLAALSGLRAYRDPHTFDVLRRLWESPLPFEGRYQICVALGECGQPGAIPLLREALGTSQLPDVRAHAALALGAFPELLEDLIRLSKADAQLAVRENALRALARSPSAEAERALRESDLKPLSEALLKERATSSPPERKAR